MVRPYIIPHEISHHFLGSSHVRNDKHNLLTEDTDFDNLGRHNSLRKNNGAGFMTKNYSNLLKILILGIVYFPNIIFANDMDYEIVKHAALAKKKSDMILTGKPSDNELEKIESSINKFCLRIIERNNVDEFYKIICSDLKFSFLHNLRLFLNMQGNNLQKKAVVASIIELHELLIANKLFTEDKYIQNLLLNSAYEENLYTIPMKKIIKKNILSGTLAPMFSEIANLYKDKDIEDFFMLSVSKATSLTVNRSTLYQFIKARHGDHTALDILIKKFNSLTLDDIMGVKYLPGLLGYTNHPEAVRQMLNVYNKPDIRPDKEDSLYNYCASSLNMLIPGFPSGNAFLGIIGDTVKMESYRRWIEENKDKYTINDVPFSRNKNIINDIIKSTLKNIKETRKINRQP